MAKPSYPTSVAAAKAASRKPEGLRISASLLARLLLAACLIGAVGAGWRFIWRTTEGELAGRPGTNDLRDETNSLLLRARSRLQRALEMNPDDPVLKVSLAEALIRYQSTFIKSGDFASADYGQLLTARRLLEESREVNDRPALIYKFTTDMARMMYAAAEHSGDKKLRDEYNTVAAENYIAYRHIAGYAINDARSFYENAVPILFREGRPHLAVTLGDDYRHVDPGAETSAGYRDALLRSHLQLGEFQNAFAGLTAELIAHPDDLTKYSTLFGYAARTHQEKYVLHLLESIARNGKLPAEIEPRLAVMRQGLSESPPDWGAAPSVP